MRWLVRENARSGCRRAERRSPTPSWSAIGSDGGAGTIYASAVSAAGGRSGDGGGDGDGEVAVRGESAHGGTEPKGRALGSHLPLADDSSDVPYLIVVGLLMLGLFAWVFAQRRRADAEDSGAI